MATTNSAGLVRVLRQVNSAWTNISYDVANFCQNNQPDEDGLIIFNSKKHVIALALQQHFDAHYHIPLSYWDLLHLRSNGFAYRELITDSQGDQKCDVIYFRFLIKHVKWPSTKDDYYWDEMTFLLHLSSSDTITALCIDCPEQLQESLVTLFKALKGGTPHDRVARFMSSIVTRLLTVYDDAVWVMRDVVRDIEKERSRSSKKKPNFVEIHEQARHAIHMSEVIEVALRTVSDLQDCLKQQQLSATPLAIQAPNQSYLLLKPQMQRSLHMLHNIKLRSNAIEKRFSNEINLAFNLVSQRDSQAMKTVATVTMSLLPATFVSTVFGMGFFNTSPNQVTGQPEWSMAKEFWIYWVVVIPLTLGTFTVWKVWATQPTMYTLPPAAGKNKMQQNKKRSSTFQLSNFLPPRKKTWSV